jgi:hypothetical protein
MQQWEEIPFKKSQGVFKIEDWGAFFYETIDALHIFYSGRFKIDIFPTGDSSFKSCTHSL